MFQDVYKDGIFRSFTDLSGEFHLPPSHLFRYFQIRHRAKSLFPPFPSSPPSQLWDEFFNLDPVQKSFISRVYYKLLLDDNSPDIKVRAAWESELDLNLDDHRWNAALDLIHKCSTCAHLTLIQFKVLFRECQKYS